MVARRTKRSKHLAGLGCFFQLAWGRDVGGGWGNFPKGEIPPGVWTDMVACWHRHEAEVRAYWPTKKPWIEIMTESKQPSRAFRDG